MYLHKLRWYNITLQEKVFHHTNGDKLIPKSYIIRDGLDTSNINGVIILNI